MHLIKSKAFWIGVAGAILILLSAETIDQPTILLAVGSILGGIIGNAGARWYERRKAQAK